MPAYGHSKLMRHWASSTPWSVQSAERWRIRMHVQMRVVETLAEEFPGVESRAIAQLQEVNIDELRGRFFELANAAQKG